MRMRPIDLLQGEMNSAPFVNLFETMGRRCSEMLSNQLKKEWGSSNQIDNTFQRAEINFRNNPEINKSKLLIHPFTLNLQTRVALLIDRSLPSMLVDIACGGNGEITTRSDRLTASESHMLNCLISHLTTQYAKALELISNNSPISFLPITNNDPHQPIIDQPELIHTMTIGLGNNSASTHLIIPEKNFRLLQINKHSTAIPAVDTQLLKQAMHTVPIPLTATLCEFTRSLGEIQQLQPGDFIPIRLASVASVRSGGKHLFNARVVKHDDRLCLQMLESVNKPNSDA